ncbi:HpcH/HpaI aldolase/citrate lyase family protein [Brevibacillus brevis]|uniref:HpcH/HpaI aldolase/citrate lyase family protein n=1 Tax=Brevibacillus brevis TaxID=1393 RepID=UPI001157DA31|nr:HpcH/HpaI aldolase/citrate lyase family protein [Lysinibacillus sp. SDF0063]TQR34830.1 citrate lyase subunit beta [Lysinibacillus sp. SDF0063]
MRHFDYLLENEKEELFSVHPLPINRNTEKEVLAHALGATLYMPAIRTTISHDVMTQKHEGLVSMVICLEDAIGDHEVTEAEQSLIRQVRDISSRLRNGLIQQDDIPIMFVRVRDVHQMNRLVEELQEDLISLTGFVFPKFTSRNAEEYLEALQSCNRYVPFPVYGMPILESADIIYRESRTAELLSIKKILDKYRHLVLNVRMGATDFSSLFGLRRGPDVSIYEISTIRDCIGDIVNMFTRQGSEYVVSGPVWEYFGNGERLLKPQLRQSPFEQKLGGASGRRLRQQLLNQWQDGLIKEVLLDKENGLTGKTIIHPSHIKIVHSLAVITREEYEDARAILQSQTNGVTKSHYANKMNEIKPHTSWAKKIMIKSKVYGVFHEHNNFINLLARTANIQFQYSR